MYLRCASFIFLIVLASAEDADHPAWHSVDGVAGRWYHDFCANLPEWATVDHDNTFLPELPAPVLPPGWIAREHDFFDTVTGDVSVERPPGFQNEAHFKAHYMRLVERVTATWQLLWPQLKALTSNDSSSSSKQEEALRQYVLSLPSDVIEIVLRVVKAPCLLSDRSAGAANEILASDIGAAARAIIRSYSDTAVHDGPVKILYIISGLNYDSYHYDHAYVFPQYIVDGLKGMFDDTRCHGYGFDQPSHALGDPVQPGHRLQADLAVVAFIRHFFPDIEVQVADPCRGLQKMLNTAYLDDFDLVINGHAGPIENLTIDQRYPPIGFAAFEDALRKTKAFVWNPSLISAISNKSHIPLMLLENGIPAIGSIPVSIHSGDEDEVAGALIQQALMRGWQAIFTKPDEGAYGRNLGLFWISNVHEQQSSQDKLAGYLGKLKRGGIKGLCAQKYIASFKQQWEIRIYFFNGQFGTAIANMVDAFLYSREFFDGVIEYGPYFFNWQWFDFEGGILNSTEFKLREKLIPLAQRALKVMVDDASPRAPLPKGADAPPLFRVDLGCCLDANDVGYDEAEGWFVNEAAGVPDFNLNYFTRQLVNTFGKRLQQDWWPPYTEYAIMSKMIQRAAATSYPSIEHTALELARFARRAAAQKRQTTQEQSRPPPRQGLGLEL